MGFRFMLPIVAALVGSATAGFKHKFENVVQGSDILMDWEPVPTENQPVYLRATVYHGTEADGYSIQEVNLTQFETGETFLWNNVPIPLPYYADANYDIQILPHTPVTGENGAMPWVTFGDSGLFSILAEGTVVGNNSSSPSQPNSAATTTAAPGQGESVGQNLNKLVLGIALGVTLPSLIALTIVGWMLVKRRERILEEKRRRRRFETIIH